MRRVLIGALAALPLLVLAGSPFVAAQQGHPDFAWLPIYHGSIGVTPGDLLRISVFNPDRSQDGLSRTIILTESGRAVFDTEEVIVPALHTVFFDLDGDSPALDEFREPGGRVQLSAIVIPYVLGADTAARGASVTALELVDAASGRTTVQHNQADLAFLSRRAARGGNVAIGTTLVLPAAPVGVTRGELLRLTAFNPDAVRRGRAIFTLFAPDGTPVKTLGPFTVEPLQTVIADVSGDDPALDAVREASGRVQLSVEAGFPRLPRSHPRVPGSAREPVLGTSAERVDAATGKASASIVMKGSKVLQN